jgi:hypothetical protein
MKNSATARNITKKQRIAPASRRAKSFNKWLRFKAITAWTLGGDAKVLKARAFKGVSIQRTSLNQEIQTTMKSTGNEAYIRLIKRQVFLRKGNRMKLGRTNQG